MKKLFKRFRKTYNKNPIAYLSLAVIAISLTVGTSVSKTSQTPQILTANLGADSIICENYDQRNCPYPCIWQSKIGSLKCPSNPKQPCPNRCKFTPEEKINCSDIKLKHKCTSPCKFNLQSTGECIKYKYINCTQANCNANESGCRRGRGTCLRKGEPVDRRVLTKAACSKQGGEWTESSSCTGKYKSNICTAYGMTGSCEGGIKIFPSKCEYPRSFLGQCVNHPSEPTSPDPSPNPTPGSTPNPTPGSTPNPTPGSTHNPTPEPETSFWDDLLSIF